MLPISTLLTRVIVHAIFCSHVGLILRIVRKSHSSLTSASEISAAKSLNSSRYLALGNFFKAAIVVDSIVCNFHFLSSEDNYRFFSMQTLSPK